MNELLPITVREFLAALALAALTTSGLALLAGYCWGHWAGARRENERWFAHHTYVPEPIPEEEVDRFCAQLDAWDGEVRG